MKREIFLLILTLFLFESCEKGRQNPYDYQSPLWPPWAVAGDFFPDKPAPNGQPPEQTEYGATFIWDLGNSWFKKHYPEGVVLVKGDVRIRERATLYIGPGVKVVFMARYDTQGFSGGWSNRADLMIDGGRLIVKGTKEKPVVFTSNGEREGEPPGEPRKGDWGQISISKQYGWRGKIDPTKQSELEYCLIEYAATGIRIINSAPKITHCIIRHIGHPLGIQYQDPNYIFPGQGILCYYSERDNYKYEDPSPVSLCRPVIKNNEIYDCAVGIKIIRSSIDKWNTVPLPIIEGNNIYDIYYDPQISSTANLWQGHLVLFNANCLTWEGRPIYAKIYKEGGDEDDWEWGDLIVYTNEEILKISAPGNWWGQGGKEEIKKRIYDRLDFYDPARNKEGEIYWAFSPDHSYHAARNAIIEFEPFASDPHPSPFSPPGE